MFDEQEIIQSVLRVAEQCVANNITTVGLAFMALAHELDVVSNKKQQEWEKRHRVMTRDVGERQ